MLSLILSLRMHLPTQKKKRKYSLSGNMCDVTMCQYHVLSTAYRELDKCCVLNHACSFVMLQWILCTRYDSRTMSACQSCHLKELHSVCWSSQHISDTLTKNVL